MLINFRNHFRTSFKSVKVYDHYISASLSQVAPVSILADVFLQSHPLRESEMQSLLWSDNKTCTM